MSRELLVLMSAEQAARQFGIIGIPMPGPEVRGDRGSVQASPVESEPADADLFPIFAECGMKPEDFVQEMAERYERYLDERNEGQE